MTRCSVYPERKQLALNQRTCILHIILCQIIAVLIDPLLRNVLHAVSDLVNIKLGELDTVRLSLRIHSLEDYHLTGLALCCSLSSHLSCCEGFVDIGQGSNVSRCSLHGGELNCTGLAASAVSNQLAKCRSGSGKLLVAKCVYLIGSVAKLACIAAVSKLQAFGNSDDNRSLGLGEVLYLIQELVYVENSLRKINSIHTAAVITLCQSCCCGQPSGIAAHDLCDHDGGLCCAEGLVVTDDFLHGCCDILRCGAVAGAVIGNRKVIVDGLRNAHEQLLLAVLLRIVAQHLYGIHGVIAACIEQGINVMLLHDLEDVLVNILVSLNLGHLEAAGAQECGRSSLEKLNSHGICKILVQINKLILKEALDSVNHAIYMLRACCLGTGIYASDGGVDDGCRTAGLTYYYVLHNVPFLSSALVPRAFRSHMLSGIEACRDMDENILSVSDAAESNPSLHIQDRIITDKLRSVNGKTARTFGIGNGSGTVFCFCVCFRIFSRFPSCFPDK